MKPTVSAITPRRRSRLGARAAVLPLLAASAAAMPATAFGAPAGNVEVVSRAWGAAGAAPFSLGRSGGGNRPLISGAVSDNGRYAAFSWGRNETPIASPYVDVDIPLYLRDVQLNQTIEIRSTGYNEATGFDRSGRYVSYLSGTVSALGPVSSVYVYDIKTKRSTLVSRATGSNGAEASDASGLISGDGRSVVFTTAGSPALPAGIYRRDLASSVTTRLGDRPERADGLDFVQLTSVSDDGRTVGATNFDWGSATEGIVLSPQGSSVVPGHPTVSGDGRTAAYLTGRAGDGAAQLFSLDTATGTRTALGVPTDGQDGSVLGVSSLVAPWVSPNGKEIAVTARRVGDTQAVSAAGFVAQLFDRTTGTFRAAGPYAASLSRYSSPFNFGGAVSISRNGRFAVVPALGPNQFNVDPEPRGLLIVDTHGWSGLPGGADLPSPNLYVDRLGPGCVSGESTIRTSFTARLAPRYLPRATSVRGVFRSGGTVLLDATVTADQEGYVRVPQGTTEYTAEITVDLGGRGKVKDTYTIPVDPSITCGG